MRRLLDQRRVASAREHYRCCRLCERDCQVDRLGGERGFCKADAQARVFRHRIEVGEELELIPSHLFYLSGCDLRCTFCIAEERAFNPQIGVPLEAESFAAAVAWGQERGARNIQWVGGEPTIHLPAILEAMSGCDSLPPVVWKSDFHGTRTAFKLLHGIVDIYVADFKFGNDRCAEHVANAPNYLPIITRNLQIAAGQGDLIVRHLLLPGHFDCCYRPIVAWLKHHLPDTKFSIRDGYLPRWTARHDLQLRQHLPANSGQAARELAQKEGLHVIT